MERIMRTSRRIKLTKSEDPVPVEQTAAYWYTTISDLITGHNQKTKRVLRKAGLDERTFYSWSPTCSPKVESPRISSVEKVLNALGYRLVIEEIE